MRDSTFGPNLSIVWIDWGSTLGGGNGWSISFIIHVRDSQVCWMHLVQFKFSRLVRYWKLLCIENSHCKWTIEFVVCVEPNLLSSEWITCWVVVDYYKLHILQYKGLIKEPDHGLLTWSVYWPIVISTWHLNSMAKTRKNRIV